MSNNEDRGFNTVNHSSLSRRDQRLKLQRMTLMVIGALMILMVITLAVLVIGYFATTGSTPPAGEVSGDKVEWTDKSITQNDTLSGALILVNSTHKYTFPQVSSHLKKATATQSYAVAEGLQADSTTLTAADLMLTALASETQITDAKIKEAYRSLEMQPSTSSVKPGYSDHHTGMLLRIESDSSNDTVQNWLQTNAHKYGFVLRYPDDKGDKTGVSGYVVYRYVGIPHATYMHQHNLCMEEYVEYLKANVTAEKPLSVTGADGKAYQVYYYAVSGDMTIKVPSNFNYTLSGTNDGGVVITVDRSSSVTEEASTN